MMMKYKEKIELFCEGALTALLWIDELGGDVVEAESEERFREFCALFFVRLECPLDALAAFQQDFGSYEQMGHDFVLTWNGHGSGIWDSYMHFDDAYSRLTFDLLAVPLHLAIRNMRESMGEILAWKPDFEDAPVHIDVPPLVQRTSEYDRRWLKGLMDEWQPEFKKFVRRHIEMPRPVRKIKAKA